MTDKQPLLSSASLIALPAACALATALAAAAWWQYGERDVDAVTDGPQPRRAGLSVIVSGDTSGWIVPCGCTSNQSGGLPRRGSFVSTIERRSEVVLVDVGGAPGGSAPYQKTKFEAILKGELAMGIRAHNLGGPEAQLGADYLRRLARDLKAPLISANLRDRHAGRQLVAEPFRIVEAAGRRILIVGVLSQQYANSELRIDEPREAILTLLEQVRDEYDWLLVLAYLPEDELRELAAALPEADLVVGGPTGQCIAPTQIGPCLLASATNKGKFVVELNAPIQRGRATWKGRIVEMTSEFDDQLVQRENLNAFRTELARLDFSARDSGFVASLPAGLAKDYRIAGTGTCLKCHQDDCQQWDESSHAHAWQTLTSDNSQVDSYCQQCHTTGYGLPGGFLSAKRSPQRYAVGCESCHGPSAAHVRRSGVRTPFVAKDQCVRCHDRENSPEFEYLAYWQQIQHGSRAETANESATKRDPNSEAQP